MKVLEALRHGIRRSVPALVIAALFALLGLVHLWPPYERFFIWQRRLQCDKIGILNGETFWVGEGWQLTITHDGGSTWEEWGPWETWPQWQCCNYRLIEKVEFRNAQEGLMNLNPLHGSEASPLRTEDEGLTWHR